MGSQRAGSRPALVQRIILDVVSLLDSSTHCKPCFQGYNIEVVIGQSVSLKGVFQAEFVSLNARSDLPNLYPCLPNLYP